MDMRGSMSAGLLNCCEGIVISKRSSGCYWGNTYANALVERANCLELVFRQVEIGRRQVLLKTALVIALGDDSNSTLTRPSEQNLGWG